MNLLDKIGKRLKIEDLKGLPDDLRIQLNFARKIPLSDEITHIIDSRYQGAADIDEIIYEFYKRKQKIIQRKDFYKIINNMLKNNMIYRVKGRRGVYCTSEGKKICENEIES